MNRRERRADGIPPVVIDRNDFARTMNLWTVFVARLMEPAVRQDPTGTARHIARQCRDFVQAVETQSSNPFLRDHAKDFAEALQKACIVESLNRSRPEDGTMQEQKLEKTSGHSVKREQRGGR